MCKNLFTERIVQNVTVIILFVFFPYHNLRIRLSVIRKDLRDPHFQEFFLCFLELWAFLVIKFGKLLICVAIANKSYS